ncbi:MAG: transglutaminase family protein [Spirochaetes bacterium]|nr:transglutaminase family protein [Spirochaetota bacterium]
MFKRSVMSDPARYRHTLLAILVGLSLLAPQGGAAETAIDTLFSMEKRTTRFDAIESGDVMDFALDDDFAYVLVRQFNMITDAVFKVGRYDGRIQRIWGIGSFGSSAIESDGKLLYVLGEKKDYFIRIFSFSGNWVRTLKLKGEVVGTLRGLGVSDREIFYTQFDGRKSELCIYDRRSETAKVVYTFNNSIDSLCLSSGRVIMYQNHFDAYASHWLFLVDFNPQRYRVMRFVNDRAIGMSSMGGGTYYLSRNQGRLQISPYTVNEDEHTVAAKPIHRKVTITYSARGFQSPGKLRLWIPCPQDSRLQRIRGLSLVPEPRGYAADRYGNKWAYFLNEQLIGRNTIEMRFEVRTAEAACTMNKHVQYTRRRIPAEIAKLYTRPTPRNDLKSPELRGILNNMPREYLYISRLLGVQRYIARNLARGEDDDRCLTAGCILRRGKGADRGRSIALSAVARLYGIPSRIVGAFWIADTKRNQGSPVRYWNQWFFPESGWIDVDTGEGRGGEDVSGRESLGYHENGYCTMFSGDLGDPDYREGFADKAWCYAVQGESIAATKGKKAVIEGISVRSDEVVIERKSPAPKRPRRRSRRKRKK